MNIKVFFAMAFTFILLASCTSADAKKRNLIKSLKISKHRVSVTINEHLREKYLKDNFYAHYESDIDLRKLPVSVALIPFITNVVSIIWFLTDDEYFVDVLDADLYKSLKRIKVLFKKLYPTLRLKGKLTPRKLIYNKMTPKVDPATDVALLFSGGLDSTVSSFRHHDKKQLLITAWGNSDYPPDNKELWKAGKARLESFAQKHGHQLSVVRSNFWFFLDRRYLDNIVPEITSWRLDTVEGLSWAGLAAPILYAKGYPLALIASSIGWEFPAKIASAPIFDDAISFAGMRTHQDAFELDRLQKFEFYRDYCRAHNLSTSQIRVCNSLGGQNCCKCIKCLQTISELMAIGEDFRDYGFDTDIKSLEKRMREFIQERSYSKRRIWHFWMIQKRLKERLARGEKLNDYLTWLSRAPIHYKPEINWRRFMSSFDWYLYQPESALNHESYQNRL